jgi:NTP pyrophosphatase (non-canonical NTP hydrolase)
VSSSDELRDLTLADLQLLIGEMYSQKDAARGVDGTFMWLMEEVGELASALRQAPGDDARQELSAEFADVLAWLATLANVTGIDLGQAVLAKYGGGCPGCGQMVCCCDLGEKP